VGPIVGFSWRLGIFCREGFFRIDVSLRLSIYVIFYFGSTLYFHALFYLDNSFCLQNSTIGIYWIHGPVCKVCLSSLQSFGISCISRFALSEAWKEIRRDRTCTIENSHRFRRSASAHVRSSCIFSFLAAIESRTRMLVVGVFSVRMHVAALPKLLLALKSTSMKSLQYSRILLGLIFSRLDSSSLR
jgi:hypothetical protein